MSNKAMKGDKPENNKSANKRARQVFQALKLTDEEIEQIHEELEDRMTYEEIETLAKQMFQPEDRW